MLQDSYKRLLSILPGGAEAKGFKLLLRIAIVAFLGKWMAS
jgi:hypothetical protein